MTFTEFIQQWTSTIFRIISDLYAEIMSHQFTAFAFWAAVVGGALLLVAEIALHPRELARSTAAAEHNITASNRGLSRLAFRDLARQHRQQLLFERFTKKRKEENRYQYAQMLLNSREYELSRYVTIEGKRYYRKGLVQRGEQMKSSDRDFSFDLDDIDKQS